MEQRLKAVEDNLLELAKIVSSMNEKNDTTNQKMDMMNQKNDIIMKNINWMMSLMQKNCVYKLLLDNKYFRKIIHDVPLDAPKVIPKVAVVHCGDTVIEIKG